VTDCDATVLALGPFLFTILKCCSLSRSWNLLAVCHLTWLSAALSHLRCLTA